MPCPAPRLRSVRRPRQSWPLSSHISTEAQVTRAAGGVRVEDSVERWSKNSASRLASPPTTCQYQACWRRSNERGHTAMRPARHSIHSCCSADTRPLQGEASRSARAAGTARLKSVAQFRARRPLLNARRSPRQQSDGRRRPSHVRMIPGAGAVAGVERNAGRSRRPRTNER